MNPSSERMSASRLAQQIAAALDEEKCFSADFTCRNGVGKITANLGSGAYTVTEQRRDPSSGLWQDAAAPLGCVAVSAWDYDKRTTGQAGQLVRFWQQRGLGGTLEVLIDVGSDLLMVSSNDAAPGYLNGKLVGDDGLGDNVKVALIEQDDGEDESLRIEIRKGDIPAGGGIDKGILHRICIPDGSGAGTYQFSADDWRGRLLLCWLQAVYSDDPSTVQWGGGATSGLTRYLGESWNSDPDRVLVSASGDSPAVMMQKGTGRLYWSWDANSTGTDLHAVCLIQASQLKTSDDYTL